MIRNFVNKIQNRYLGFPSILLRVTQNNVFRFNIFKSASIYMIHVLLKLKMIAPTLDSDRSERASAFTFFIYLFYLC